MTDKLLIDRELLERICSTSGRGADILDTIYHPIVVDELRSLLAQPSEPTGWVAVTERLPSVAQEVIVSADFEGVCAGVLDSYDEWFAPCSEYKLTRVTHWMPLPAAPSAEGEV